MAIYATELIEAPPADRSAPAAVAPAVAEPEAVLAPEPSAEPVAELNEGIQCRYRNAQGECSWQPEELEYWACYFAEANLRPLAGKSFAENLPVIRQRMRAERTRSSLQEFYTYGAERLGGEPFTSSRPPRVDCPPEQLRERVGAAYWSDYLESGETAFRIR